ncbi:unnamed protein product [Stenotrophomonas maltophilia]|nr:unnamed protein product [Stenotrophomonas maltophilia]
MKPTPGHARRYCIGRMLWQPSGRGTEAAHAMDDLQLSALRRCRATVSTALCRQTPGEDGMPRVWRGAALGPTPGHAFALSAVHTVHRHAGCISHDLGLHPGSMVLADGDLGPGIGAVLAARHDQACTQPDLPRHAGSESKLRSTQALGTGTGG